MFKNTDKKISWVKLLLRYSKTLRNVTFATRLPSTRASLSNNKASFRGIWRTLEIWKICKIICTEYSENNGRTYMYFIAIRY